jgi:hypothetical protein
MGQVNADMRLDRIVEGLEPAELEAEHAAAASAAREVIAYAESRGFKVTWAHVQAAHGQTLAEPQARRLSGLTNVMAADGEPDRP